MTLPPDPHRPLVVLDTNVVLDWMVFRHPVAVALGTTIIDGRLVWIATAAMREELHHVLSTGRLDRWNADVARMGRDWDRWCRTVHAPAHGTAGRNLRCSDPDDQMFIDLAMAQRCHWLLTRDRAVLKLAARLRAHRIAAVTPEQWQRAGCMSGTSE